MFITHDHKSGQKNAAMGLAGFMAALLVLAPEGLAACRPFWESGCWKVYGFGTAADRDRAHRDAVCGNDGFSGNRTHILAGAVLQVLFASQLILIFD